MAAFLKVHNEMKKQVKARKTDWSNPEPSDEEEDDPSSAETSSREEEPEAEVEESNKEVQSEKTIAAASGRP